MARTPEEYEELNVTEARDSLISYQIAAANERKERDRVVVNWQMMIKEARQKIRDFLEEVGHGDPRKLKIADDRLSETIALQDEFLNRSKK